MLLLLPCLLLALAQMVPQRDRRPAETPDAPSASISGRVTDRDSGQPMARALVRLYSADRSRSIEAAADADGKYELTELPPGEYLLWAGPPELRSTHLQQIFGDPEPSELMFPRANVRLKAGQALTGHDIALFRALAIEGRVVDPWDEPMAEVEVRVSRSTGTLVVADVARTDDRGMFRLFGLPPGRYHVCAEPRHGVTDDPDVERSRMVHTCHPAAVDQADAGEVVLTTADATGIDVLVQLGGTYSIWRGELGFGSTLSEDPFARSCAAGIPTGVGQLRRAPILVRSSFVLSRRHEGS